MSQDDRAWKLEELLVEEGWEPEEAPETDPPIASDEQLEFIEPVADRGWCDRFDLEGSFQIEGRHAETIERLCEMVDADYTSIEDRWYPNEGWLVVVRRDGEDDPFFKPVDRTRSSDWGEINLVVEAARPAIREAGFELFKSRTSDQTVLLGALPSDVYGAAVDNGLIDVEDLNHNDVRRLSDEEYAEYVRRDEDAESDPKSVNSDYFEGTDTETAPDRPSRTSEATSSTADRSETTSP
ncbi:MAG: hypothetical protein ABEN55_03595, partial [Bradymonadaceae bacterium]